ncbi:MAG: hypothetical protein M5U14_22075 [Acidimicrobiia bacterium]|nr:hypothetical protein [Acidimicrobiia bacterium]
MLGRAPIVDFDGTLAALDVDWAGLRRTLGVARILDLWSEPGGGRWAVVDDAELRAATSAHPVSPVIGHLGAADAFAVLTNNCERSVWRFLERFDELAGRARAVVGRETLQGPKTDFTVFARGFATCVEATAPERGPEDVVYVGDQDYELEFASRLGARSLHVLQLGAQR